MKVVQFILGCIGRILISLIFIFASLGHMLNWQGSLTYLQTGLQTFATQALAMKPYVQPALDYALTHLPLVMGTAVILMLLGGLLVFFGLKTRFGAFLLMLFIIPTTLIMHAFWGLQGAERELQMTMFMKNLSILGGLFYLLAFANGCGPEKKRSEKPKAAEKK